MEPVAAEQVRGGRAAQERRVAAVTGDGAEESARLDRGQAGCLELCLTLPTSHPV